MARSPEAGAPDPARFEALFNQAQCGYPLTDDGGRISAVNDTFVSWTGYGRSHRRTENRQVLHQRPGVGFR